MSFSDFYVNHRTRKGNFLNQIEQLIDWTAIDQTFDNIMHWLRM